MSSARRLAYRAFGRLPVPVKMLVNRGLNQRFLVGVIGVVRNEQREVLLLRHTYRPGFSWGLPTGWLGRRESVERALEERFAKRRATTSLSGVSST